MRLIAFLLFFLFSSAQTMAAEDPRQKSYVEIVADLIAKEEEFAKLLCERIKSDALWKKVADALNERAKLVLSVSEKERRSLDLSVKIWKPVWDELQKIDGIYFRIRSERAEKFPDLRSVLELTRAVRVLRMCGEELFRDGLLPPVIGAYTTSVIDSDELKQRINSLSSELKSHDDMWLEIARNSQNMSAAAVEGRLISTTQNSGLFYPPDLVTKKVWFPMYYLYIGGDKLFANEFDYEKFKSDNDKEIASAVDELKRERQREAEREAREARDREMRLARAREREERIKKIRNGNIKIAQYCSEVSVALIPKDELRGDYYSKDFREIYVRPTNKLYAGFGEIIDSDKTTITGLHKNWLPGKGVSGFLLRHNKDTLWLGNNIAYQNTINFVGRYVGNASISIRSGNDVIRVPLRVYDAICISNHSFPW